MSSLTEAFESGSIKDTLLAIGRLRKTNPKLLKTTCQELFMRACGTGTPEMAKVIYRGAETRKRGRRRANIIGTKAWLPLGVIEAVKNDNIEVFEWLGTFPSIDLTKFSRRLKRMNLIPAGHRIGSPESALLHLACIHDSSRVAVLLMEILLKLILTLSEFDRMINEIGNVLLKHSHGKTAYALLKDTTTTITNPRVLLQCVIQSHYETKTLTPEKFIDLVGISSTEDVFEWTIDVMKADSVAASTNRQRALQTLIKADRVAVENNKKLFLDACINHRDLDSFKTVYRCFDWDDPTNDGVVADLYKSEWIEMVDWVMDEYWKVRRYTKPRCIIRYANSKYRGTNASVLHALRRGFSIYNLRRESIHSLSLYAIGVLAMLRRTLLIAFINKVKAWYVPRIHFKKYPVEV